MAMVVMPSAVVYLMTTGLRMKGAWALKVPGGVTSWKAGVPHPMSLIPRELGCVAGVGPPIV